MLGSNTEADRRSTGHIREAYSRAYLKMDKRDLSRKLEVTLAALLGALDATPARNHPEWATHLRQTKTLVSLYADAAFARKQQADPVSKRSKKR